jgi:flagellar biosynthetic protein FliP
VSRRVERGAQGTTALRQTLEEHCRFWPSERDTVPASCVSFENLRSTSRTLETGNSLKAAGPGGLGEPLNRAFLKRLALLCALAHGAVALVFAAPANNDSLQSFGITAQAGRGMTLSVPMQIALGLTLLTLLPAVIMCITPFLRIAVVLHFLRQALGTQSAPSNQVLVGLSLFLSLLIVQPVFNEIYAHAWQPLENGQISAGQALDLAAVPLRTFLLRFARERDIRLFVEISREPAPRSPSDISLKILIPSYILSELKAGFQIGAVLFLPFLVIDIAVASVTLSIGMMQLPPALISAPFKILLFVLVDGWNLVVGSLMKSFFAQ